ncbi:DUF3987 domain-containing protein [Kitasatospora purpeofusca]|uniref:DUF3987 domain-containing protein n=1 Tax=Kitasatospora purpeofusca TaxID=67352 RepID=UPI0036E850DA
MNLRPVGAPVLANEAYAGLAGRIVRHVEPMTEADNAGMLASLFAGFSAMIGNGPKVRVGRRRQSLAIWSLMMGPTGEGRKGTATDEVEEFLRVAEPKFFEGKNVSTSLNTGEGLIYSVRDHRPKKVKDPETGEWEEELTGGVDDKRLLVIATEYVNVMSKSGGGILGGVLRDAWDGKNLVIKTKESETASGAHIVVLGHVTPDEFDAKMKPSDLAGGSYNRFLTWYVHKDKDVPIPPHIDEWEETTDALAEELRAAVESAKKVTEVTLTAPAQKLYVDKLYGELSYRDETDPVIKEFVQRHVPYLMRLAAVYALMDQRDKIGVKDLKAAKAVLDYCLASTAFLRKNRAVPVNRQWENAKENVKLHLEDAGEKGMTRMDLMKLTHYNFSGDRFTELMASVGAVESKVARGGRPTRMYSLPAARTES